MKYLLDSNLFIQSHRVHYPFDIFPSFWAWIMQLADEDKICIFDKVYRELTAGNKDDALAIWVGDLPRKVFCSSEELIGDYLEITNWARTNTQYNESAKKVFLESERADAWLVACARSKGYTLVTWEASSPNSKSKIKIPDVCKAFGLSCISPIDMFRLLGVKI